MPDMRSALFPFRQPMKCARDHQRSSETPPYWTAKLFGILAGFQDGTVLADRIWLGETCYDGRERLVAMLCGDPPSTCREFGAGVGTPRIVTPGTRAPCAGPALDGGRIGRRCRSIARMLRSRHATIPEGVGRDGYERQKIRRRRSRVPAI